MLDQQQGGSVVGMGGDELRSGDTRGAGHPHRANLTFLCPGLLGRRDTHDGTACAAGSLVAHEPRRAARAQACYGRQLFTAGRCEGPRRNVIQRGIRH